MNKRLEEWTNTLTHGIGAIFGIIALTLMVVTAVRLGDPWRLAAGLTYGVSLTVLFLASTLYHGAQKPRLKQLFQKLDHCAIYFLIAGTYTPFLLISLRGAWGYWLFAVIWSMAIFGIVFTLMWRDRFPRTALVTYIAMGWLIIIAAGPMIDAVPQPALWLLLTGGIAYTLGTLFYAKDEQIPFGHAIWHVFVLIGAASHFAAIYFYLLAPTGGAHTQ